uniref:Hydroxymethylglutaryl-CoA synthase 1 n=1 Tax=Triatoma infestans TaxID=30076 RepID=A0A161N350_TRIIF
MLNVVSHIRILAV